MIEDEIAFRKQLVDDVLLDFKKSHDAYYAPGDDTTVTITLPFSRWRHLVEYLRGHSDMRDVESALCDALKAAGKTPPPDKQKAANEARRKAKAEALKHASLIPDDIERGNESIKCECGGWCDLVVCTDAECVAFGCGRDQPGDECCAAAFVCCVCSKRYAGQQPAPEMG